LEKNLIHARQRAGNCLASGEPAKKWMELLAAQGADESAFQEKLSRDHEAEVIVELVAQRDGYVAKCDARIVGEIVRELGGGRLNKHSVIRPEVGVDRLAKPGDIVRKGDVLGRVHAADSDSARAARERLTTAFDVTDSPLNRVDLVVDNLP
jgi:thymidine phosphorylase